MQNIKMESITKLGKLFEPFEVKFTLFHIRSRNNKRVAEIWLGEYKKFFYERHPERYQNLDIGDISQQVALKESLGCRSFSFFLDVVAPDMLERFPLVDFLPFASGAVREPRGKILRYSNILYF